MGISDEQLWEIRRAASVTTSAPIGDDVQARFNQVAVEGWQLVGITAAPLVTGWISHREGTGATGFGDKVHYLATFQRGTP